MESGLQTIPAMLPTPGQVAIVTGGSRGIGRAITEALLAAGCEVAICGRKAPQDLPALAGRAADFSVCDVRDARQARGFVDAVAGRFGRLDIVVNNAGGSPHADAATVSPRFSEAVVALNLLAPLHIAQAAYRWMATQPAGGVIINIASVAGARPSPGTAAYGAAKAGLLSLSKSLAQEWGPKVRVNAIIGGLIETETSELTYGSPAARAAIAASLPLRRMGRGSDIAAVVLFLASPAAAYLSGAEIAVDGGGERPLFLELVAAAAGVSSADPAFNNPK
jgi:NAD(P)-dependent dehydrogenase (short-subunit alcohol dehydrogenase family)